MVKVFCLRSKTVMALAWAGDDILAEIASNFCMGPHTEEGEASHATYQFN